MVDIACGSAPMHDHFTTAQTYVGLDLSVAELLAGRSRGRAVLAHADALRLPVASGAADVVVCSMALMLLAPVTDALAEVARVLRPGGTFALIRPVATPFHVRDLHVGTAILRGLRRGPQMPQRFGASSLRRSLRGAGLAVVSDEAVRFSYPLRDLDDARLAMSALYLPDVAEARREQAARRLSRHAGPNADLPVSIRRTVAVRPTLDVRSS